jgi:hypothetical protein
MSLITNVDLIAIAVICAAADKAPKISAMIMM